LNTLGCKLRCWNIATSVFSRASLEFALRAAGVEPSEPMPGPLFDKYLDLAPSASAKR
jgi:hypothetical protein